MNDQFYEMIFDSISDGIYYINKDRIITYWNRGAEKLTGYTAAEVIATSCKDNLLRHVDENGVDLCVHGCPMEATMHDGECRSADVFMHHKLGHRVPIRVKSFPLNDDFGNIIGAAELFTAINEKKDMAHQLEILRKEAMTDPLTGVANRRCLDLAARHFQESVGNSNTTLGILFVDIDYFKKINDRWGHSAGDKVLSMVAKTLSAALRPSDIASRWGGEEFVIFVPDIDRKGLAVLAERLRRLVELSWFETGSGRISVTVSLGGTMLSPGEDTCSAISRADELAYRSKKAGRNCIHIDNSGTH
ncbi:diguanylate cyclase [Maridesulfovibrio sp. FT414]|uniref:GGDEF domain-containing protein n=1 Tax=Maridesulfovibrio sp. FT414 TaxID=2979469 RepID=UPI003D804FB1